LFHWAHLLGPSWGWLLRRQRKEFQESSSHDQLDYALVFR
jgi:uncharacterized Tic20 family protein